MSPLSPLLHIITYKYSSFSVQLGPAGPKVTLKGTPRKQVLPLEPCSRREEIAIFCHTIYGLVSLNYDLWVLPHKMIIYYILLVSRSCFDEQEI